MTVSSIRVGSLCLFQALCSRAWALSPRLMKKGHPGLQTPLKQQEAELAGERAPSQKRALFSKTRFDIRNHWDFSAGLWIENLHLWKLWALGDQIILNSYINSCILTRKAGKM